MNYSIHFEREHREELDLDTLIELSTSEVNLYLDRLAKIDQYDAGNCTGNELALEEPGNDY